MNTGGVEIKKKGYKMKIMGMEGSRMKEQKNSPLNERKKRKKMWIARVHARQTKLKQSCGASPHDDGDDYGGAAIIVQRSCCIDRRRVHKASISSARIYDS